jgi:hypothetical protein
MSIFRTEWTKYHDNYVSKYFCRYLNKLYYNVYDFFIIVLS